MKPKPIFIAGAIIVCLALGIFALVKWRAAAPASGDDSADDNLPTVVSIQTGKLQRLTLHDYISGYGTVTAAPADENQPAAGGQLAAPSAGVVAKVNAVVGRRVQKDDVLVELNSAAATYDYAKAEVERQQQLYAQQNTSLKDLEDAKSQLASLEVVAPVSGTVTFLGVSPGQAVDSSTEVAEVIDLSRLAVATKIPEAQAVALKPGEEIQVLTTPPVTAPVSFVSPTVDTNDGTLSAWAALPPDSALHPGQFVQLKIVTATHTNCLAAPEDSVVTDESGQSAISLITDNHAAQLPVQTGFREDGWVEVEGKGIAEGDTVATVGAYGLPDQTKVQIVNPSDDASNPADASDSSDTSNSPAAK
ncbi:MAG: efflux RND transporter periplasmic adaptor subunit [Limisphaerales bacterium]